MTRTILFRRIVGVVAVALALSTIAGAASARALLFPSDSYWNTAIATTPTVATNNNSMVNGTNGLSSAAGGAMLTSAGTSVPPVFVASNSDPLQTVQIDDPSCAASTVQIHIPSAASTALNNGSWLASEGPAAVLNTDTGIERDFYHFAPPGTDGRDGCTPNSNWHALGTDNGSFTTGPGTGFGFRAARTPEAAGLMLQRDGQSGIPSGGNASWPHALAVSLHNVLSTTFWPPASSTDGPCTTNTNLVCIPEGARIQIIPNGQTTDGNTGVDCQTYPDFTNDWQRVWCHTMQTYGAYVVDNNCSVCNPSGDPPQNIAFIGQNDLSLTGGFSFPGGDMPASIFSHVRVLNCTSSASCT